MTLARTVLLTVALATVCGWLLVQQEPPQLWRLGLAIGIVAVTQQLGLRMRMGAAVVTLGWGEAALIVTLFVVPPGWLPLTFAAGTLLGIGLRWVRRSPLPAPPAAVWAVASYSVAAGAAAALAVLVAPPFAAQVGPAVAAGLLLGAVGYLLTTTVTASVLAALQHRVRTWRLLLRGVRRKIPMFVGNVTIGLTVVALASADVRWLAALPVAVWLLHRTYTHRLRISETRRMWSAFAGATRSLNRPDLESVASAGVRGALDVFSVGRAEVSLDGDGGARRTWVGDQADPVRMLPAGAAEAQVDSGAPVTSIPLLLRGDELGLLRVHFPRMAGPGNGEEAALQAYADALAAAVHDTATHQELHQVLARSAHEAQHDPLTGLLNRAALLARGEPAVQLVPRVEFVALLLVDIDHFREINDTLGHAAGDEVLTVTATRLREASRAGELLCRLGGDEFALLVTGGPGGDDPDSRPGSEVALQAAVGRGWELARLLAEEADISGVPVSLEASVGVVVAPGGTADVAELLRRADAAMYQAKHGGATVCPYESAQDASSKDRPALLAELRGALERDDELVLALQPVVELATGAPTGVEALVRWRHPQRGLLPPAEFLRAVENSDLLGTFTEYVIDKALSAAARWARRGPGVPVAVNLSARSLLDPRLPQAIAALLRKHRIPGRRLILEITETVVTSDLPGIDEALANLRALGVRLAVDDFGTGYASLTFLTRMPLDEVKVDGRFVDRMDTSAEAAAIIRTAVELGRDLGIRVIAEGVETAAQRQMLDRLGCTSAQGFLFATPTTVERIGPTLRSLAASATRARVIPLTAAGAAGLRVGRRA